MPQFQTKAGTAFDAEQYTGPEFVPAGTPVPPNSPPWLTWIPIGYNGERWPHMPPLTGEAVRLAPNDYVLLHPKHGPRRFTPADFESYFEPHVPPPPAPTPAELAAAPPTEDVTAVLRGADILFDVIDLPFGITNTRLHKRSAVGHNGFSHPMTDDEITLFSAARTLAAEVLALRRGDQVAGSPATGDAPPTSPPAPAEEPTDPPSPPAPPPGTPAAVFRPAKRSPAPAGTGAT